jgi:hypothetical protein
MPGEETFTDINLLEIQAAHPRLVKVWKFSKYREATQSGADWEWWIGRGRRWVGMRVQAKNVSPTTTTAQLARRLRYRGGQQLALLLASSARDGLFPLYCFYNADTHRLRGARWCQPCRCTACGPFPQVFGCAIVPATSIRFALASRNAARVPWACFPWSCLVCGGCFPPRANSLAEQIYHLLRATSEDLEFKVSPLREQLPDYVEALREGVRPERIPEVRWLLLIEEGEA